MSKQDSGEPELRLVEVEMVKIEKGDELTSLLSFRRWWTSVAASILLNIPATKSTVSFPLTLLHDETGGKEREEDEATDSLGEFARGDVHPLTLGSNISHFTVQYQLHTCTHRISPQKEKRLADQSVSHA